jgi:16S rRNA (adenine1518-N6/adenine1519-N6)-dimethyltransferase
MAALAARGLAPRHRFGQNFLVRGEALDRIADAAQVEEGQTVLEVGPGLGGLTSRLLDRGARVIAVEIDSGLSDFLQDELGHRPGFHLLRGDVMARKSALSPQVLGALETLEGSAWKVVANLPYQISSPFLMALPLLSDPPTTVVVTLQKEVGGVLSASPSSANYSPLSFLARLAWDVERLFNLPPTVFHPIPDVTSSVLRLRRRAKRSVPLAATVLLARRLFQTRRKALRATLPRAAALLGAGAIDCGAVLEEAGLLGLERIDAIPPEQVERLAGILLREGTEDWRSPQPLRPGSEFTRRQL